jgi:molecular chaperone GrpE (heat shock protein)
MSKNDKDKKHTEKEIEINRESGEENVIDENQNDDSKLKEELTNMKNALLRKAAEFE